MSFPEYFSTRHASGLAEKKMRGGSIFPPHFTKKNWNYQKKYLSLQHRNEEYVDMSNISKLKTNKEL